MKGKDKICFVSVDVEHDIGSDQERTFKGVERVEEILNVFNHFGISSTLFVTGEVLEKYGTLAREWSGGHEIACHSYSHTFFDVLHVADVRDEIERSIHIYKKVFSSSPWGFRAPSHIIENTTVRTLSDTGFIYDSSVVPHYPFFKKYRGYMGAAPKTPYNPSEIAYRKEGDSDIVELPVSGHLGGLPLAGAWIRGVPFWVYSLLFSTHCPRYISFSLHSWDVLHDDRFSDKLYKILQLLKNRGYSFKNGKEIAHEYISKNR